MKLNFFHYIKKKYGEIVAAAFRKMNKLHFKNLKITSDIKFLTDCIENDVFPKFLNFKLSNELLRRSDCYATCKKLLLNEELKMKNRDIKKAFDLFTTSKRELSTKLSFLDYIAGLAYISRSSQKQMAKVKRVHAHKLDDLLFNKSGASLDPNKIVVNLSDRPLTMIEKLVLSNGLKHSVTPKRLEYGEYLLPFEKLMRFVKMQTAYECDNISQQLLKTQIREVALSSYFTYDPSKLSNLSKRDFEILTKLSKEKSIIVLKADKGNQVVVMNRKDYSDKLNAIVSDQTNSGRSNPVHEMYREESADRDTKSC